MEYAKNYIIILIETDKSMYITMYRGNISLTEKELLKIIKRGECHTTEFKKSTTDITKDIYMKSYVHFLIVMVDTLY